MPLPTPSDLSVITSCGNMVLTKAMLHEDYAVWRDNKLLAVGGFKLMQQVFNEWKDKPVTTTINIEQRVAQYLKLRDAIKAHDDAHKEKMKPFRETLEKLNNLLLDHLNNVGVESARTDVGTVYKTTKKSASLEDADQFRRHVIGTENWDLLDWKASQAGVEAFAKENNGNLPPGVKFSMTAVVGVRKA